MNRRDFIQAAALAPVLLAAGPQGDDLAKKFETLRAADPVAALKFLTENPGEPATKRARPAIAKQITQDVAAGLKAYQEGKGDQAEPRFTRAALLADLYGPDFSRQLMRLVFLLKQPKKTPTGCAVCKGAGAAACKDCQAGLALGPCTRCETKGSVPCLLCNGGGTPDHPGDKGTLHPAIENTFPLTVKNHKGKTPRGKAPP